MGALVYIEDGPSGPTITKVDVEAVLSSDQYETYILGGEGVLAGLCAKRGLKVRPDALVCYVESGGEDTVVASRLIDAGADVEAEGGDPLAPTALILAARKGLTGLVKTLLGYGADVYARNENGPDAAFRWAAERGHIETMRLLRESGADVHASNGPGNKEAALRRSVICKQYASVRLLIEWGADVNYMCDKTKITPLIEAAFQGDKDMVELLLDNKADIHFCSPSGRNALSHAIVEKHFEVATLLRSRGAKLPVNAKDLCGDMLALYINSGL